MLHLNKKKIQGSELKIAVSLSLAGEDLSGQSSHTAIAETGDKPKQLNISVLIKFDNASHLTDLVNLAEAKDDNGERINYDIVNDTAKAMNIRKVRFLGDFSAREDESLALWRVAFKLSEVKSISEIKEARKTAQPVADQSPTGSTTVPTDTQTPDVAELSSFENILSWVENRISGDGTSA